jgi:ankyrin repeat protein
MNFDKGVMVMGFSSVGNTGGQGSQFNQLILASRPTREGVKVPLSKENVDAFVARLPTDMRAIVGNNVMAHFVRNLQPVPYDRLPHKQIQPLAFPLSSRMPDGRPVLISLLQKNRMDIFLQCLNEIKLQPTSLDLTAKGKFGFTALSTAVLFGHATAVSALLDAGATVDAKNTDGTTVFDWARDCGEIDILKNILLPVSRLTDQQKNTLQAETQSIHDALHAAAQAAPGNAEKVDRFCDLVGRLQTPEDPEMIIDENPALIIGEIAHLIKNGLPVDAVVEENMLDSTVDSTDHAFFIPSGYQHNALCQAVCADSTDAVEALLLLGADVNRHLPHIPEYNNLPFDKGTILQLSANSKMTQILLNAGADVDAASYAGYTALYVAAAKEHSETPIQINLLLQAGTLIDRQNVNGRTALHAACNGECWNNAIALVNANADLYKIQKGIGTALVYCCSRGSDDSDDAMKLVKLMLDKAAFLIDYASDEGRTPLMAADEAKHSKIAALLRQKEKELSECDIDQPDAYGRTRLSHAIKAGNESTIRMLLEKGADIKEAMWEGNNVLHLAAENPHAQAFFEKFLEELPEGAINQQNKDGNTPLHLALMAENVGCITLLQAHDAKSEIKNKDNKTAFSLSMEWNQRLRNQRIPDSVYSVYSVYSDSDDEN